MKKELLGIKNIPIIAVLMLLTVIMSFNIGYAYEEDGTEYISAPQEIQLNSPKTFKLTEDSTACTQKYIFTPASSGYYELNVSPCFTFLYIYDQYDNFDLNEYLLGVDHYDVNESGKVACYLYKNVKYTIELTQYNDGLTMTEITKHKHNFYPYPYSNWYGVKEYLCSVEGCDGANYVVTSKPTGIKLQAGKKSFTAYWGYKINAMSTQIQYATNKKFKNAKTKKEGWYCRTIKGLNSHKKYYVRMRAFTTRTDLNGTKYYYGKWSKVKTVRTK